MDLRGVGVGPILHTGGQFAGQTIRMEIVEIQQAERGRKYAAVDRRPIDPPPVLLLSIFRVENAGTPFQKEVELDNYEDVLTDGLFGTIDILSINSAQQTATTNTATSDYSIEMSRMSPSIVTQLPNNATKSIVGEKTVPAVNIQYGGKEVIMFVFGDIAVRDEGSFYPFYRVVDITNSRDGIAPVTACCWGGHFQMYSTKGFPGLGGSTELTKVLSDAGAKVHIRREFHHRRSSTMDNPASNIQALSPN
ncbi:velvet factor [Flagelloscypha sp. PMI_526]|nr:velvet factor [Flagelloscypha sp. PMI_526]